MLLRSSPRYVSSGYGFQQPQVIQGSPPLLVTTGQQQVVTVQQPFSRDISQTVVNPPNVSEVRINELLPFQVTPSYSISRWYVRSNVADRGQLANQMLLVWRPEDVDYGSNVETSAIPQVFLFRDAVARQRLQDQLYRQYPQLNLQSYNLRVPVRVETHTLPGAGIVAGDNLVI